MTYEFALSQCRYYNITATARRGLDQFLYLQNGRLILSPLVVVEVSGGGSDFLGKIARLSLTPVGNCRRGRCTTVGRVVECDRNWLYTQCSSQAGHTEE